MSGVVDGVFALSVPASDLLPVLSLAVAVTSVPSFTLLAGIVIAPVVSSTVTSDPAGTVHLPSSPFVAVTVLSFPSLSLYVTSTVFVSASVGGVTVTLPSSFAFTVGAAGFSDGVVAVPAVDTLPASSFAFALTSVLSFTLSAGIVTTPDAGSIFKSLLSGSDQFP